MEITESISIVLFLTIGLVICGAFLGCLFTKLYK